MIKRLTLAVALCGLSTAALARGDFDFQFAGSGGMGTFNPSAAPSANAPIIKFTASGQPYMSGGKAITLPGASKPITLALKSPITKAAAGAAAARFAAAMTPLGAFMTVTSLAMMMEAEYRNLKRTSDGWTGEQRQDESNKNCVAPHGGGYVATKCWDGRFAEPVTDKTGYCVLSRELPPDTYAPTVCERYGTYEVSTAINWRPVALTERELADAIAKQSGWPTSQTLTDALAHPDVNFDPGTKPQVSGVPQVQGLPQTETRTNPDGSTTTTTRTPVINIQYTGPTITTTTTTTTTTTNTAPDGSTTTDTTTDTTTLDEPKPTEEPAPGLCDLFPDILACKKLQQPTEEALPKRTEDISLQTGPTFSGGSCPPDVVVNVGGRQVTVLSTAQPCGWIETYMKPIILLLASISAAFIVLPRAD